MTHKVTAPLADIMMPRYLARVKLDAAFGAGPSCCCLAGALLGRQAASQASEQSGSCSSDEDYKPRAETNTSEETSTSEEEDSDDSSAGGEMESQAYKTQAVRARRKTAGVGGLHLALLPKFQL